MAQEVPPPTPKKSTCAMHKCFYCPWAQLGLNQRPPDYEAGATNRLSYGPPIRVQIYTKGMLI